MDGAPLCRQCGGLVTNPSATHCRFCGTALFGPWAPSQPFSYRAAMAMHPYHRAIEAGGKTSFFWLRVVIIAIAVLLSALATCVSTFGGSG